MDEIDALLESKMKAPATTTEETKAKEESRSGESSGYSSSSSESSRSRSPSPHKPDADVEGEAGDKREEEEEDRRSSHSRHGRHKHHRHASRHGSHNHHRHHHHHSHHRDRDHDYRERRDPFYPSRRPAGVNYAALPFYRPRWANAAGAAAAQREARQEKKPKQQQQQQQQPPEDPKEAEKKQIERDSRTVFACNMSTKADEAQVREFFAAAGRVIDVRLITDRNSHKSKGVGYIEFETADAVPVALAMSGQPLLGQPVVVQQTQSEKNRAAAAAAAVMAATLPAKVYVGNLHSNIGEEELRVLFGTFGEIDSVTIPSEPGGQSKGFAFVLFRKPEDARKAIQQANGLELAGREIKVSFVNATEAPSTALSTLLPPPAFSSDGTLDELDDDGKGLALTAQSRALLMANLQRSAVAGQTPTLNSVSPSTTPQPVLVPVKLPSGITIAVHPDQAQVPAAAVVGSTSIASQVAAASTCILIKNMFDPATETDPNFDQEIQEDVVMESSKFGTVLGVHVDKRSLGHVYVKFASIASAQRTIASFQGRFFAGKQITAEFISEATYASRYPE